MNTKIDRRPTTGDRLKRARAAATASPETPPLRSRRQPVGYVFSPEMEFALARWRKQSKVMALAVDRDAYTRSFLSWLLTRNAVMTTTAHQCALDHQRADLAGEAQMLVRVGGEKRGAIELTFTDGSRLIGAAEVRPEALPAGTRQGEILLLTLSHPRCRACGCTSEQACPGGCTWIAPDRCSRCRKTRRRKS